ncbi:U6 snRNA phosphodiesterase 1 [Oratosquilla oratoria]|uniref:U6 snRNA phosphodiesterase 1 n=1 Tax=Oratosquilla oratoria TaxID=337810 RepID=UPI003F758CBB
MATGRRGALSLLQNYGSDSDEDSGYTSEDEKKRKTYFSNPHERTKKRRKVDEEEDMMVDSQTPSPPHPSSGPRTEGSSIPGAVALAVDHIRNRNLIPFPSELLPHDTGEREDRSQHQGRVRSFTHERGNWASILYVPIQLGVQEDSFKSFVASILELCKQNSVALSSSTDLHISLTRTLVLRLHWIQPIVEDLRARLTHVNKFSLWLHGVGVYLNEERTRTFLGLRVCHGRSELQDIVSEIDSCLTDYRLPSFYKDGSFHVSIAWCVGDEEATLRTLLPQLENVCSQYFAVESDMRTFDVTVLHFKTGNRIHHINLHQGH